LAETIADLVSGHRSGRMRPADTVARTYARIRTHDDPAIFITLRPEADAIAEAQSLDQRRSELLPLFGIPVAVKDNIDVAGMPTTAACPAFAYRAKHDAGVVARLKRAGAIVIGKTNLDQFATGLVGVRSPYGIPRNVFDPKLIPGGSSSGSAVAVAAGLVPLAIGTDTAGSGRVPAGLGNIVGLKPSLGLVSTTGVVPACRTLDCVAFFTLTVDDAFAALQATAGFDPIDLYSRAATLGVLGPFPPSTVLGVPLQGQRIFFDDRSSAEAYEDAVARFARLGTEIRSVDIEPLFEAARLLYEGPWVAERYLATRALLASDPGALHPVTREIILGGARSSAADAFAAFYQLKDLERTAARLFAGTAALLVPTVPTAYTVDQVLADPIQLNSRLGTYTNFVNLLGLCGIAVPAALENGHPFGVTLLAPAGNDAALASIARVFHADTGLQLGATGEPQSPLRPLNRDAAEGEIAIAVVGAHLSGMPLNAELRALGGRFLEETRTAAVYRLFALVGTTPPKPGMLRVDRGAGVGIDLEVWALPTEGFGRFVASVPPPLSIGTVALADGRTVKGFLVESAAVAGARDISQFGGWRRYLKQAQSVEETLTR
jgi:allophanate hydrolase